MTNYTQNPQEAVEKFNSQVKIGDWVYVLKDGVNTRHQTDSAAFVLYERTAVVRLVGSSISCPLSMIQPIIEVGYEEGAQPPAPVSSPSGEVSLKSGKRKKREKPAKRPKGKKSKSAPVPVLRPFMLWDQHQTTTDEAKLPMYVCPQCNGKARFWCYIDENGTEQLRKGVNKHTAEKAGKYRCRACNGGGVVVMDAREHPVTIGSEAYKKLKDEILQARHDAVMESEWERQQMGSGF